jgi:general secretion pathway protein C
MALFALLIIYSLWQVVTIFKIADYKINLVNTQIVIPTVADISPQHLFGQYDENLSNLPSTQLKLTLQGIAMGVIDSEGSRALIAAPNQPAKVYKIGDSLPGGAVIHEILRDRVILNDSGRFENLNLPVPPVSGTITEVH